jgi:hypothetical protein
MVANNEDLYPKRMYGYKSLDRPYTENLITDGFSPRL